MSRRGPDGGGFVANSGSGDVYAGRDGNVYRNQGGSWQKYENGGWTGVQPTADQKQQAQQRATQAQDRANQARTSGLDSNTAGQLNRDQAIRSEGMQRTQDLNRTRTTTSPSMNTRSGSSGTYRPSAPRMGGGGGRRR